MRRVASPVGSRFRRGFEPFSAMLVVAWGCSGPTPRPGSGGEGAVQGGDDGEGEDEDDEGSDDGAGVGSPCSRSDDCGSGVCIDEECASTCAGPADCDGDSVCAPVEVQAPEGPEMAFMCTSGTLGGAGLGASCQIHGDCAAAFCLHGQCTEMCVDNECLPGQHCLHIDVPERPGTVQTCGYPPRVGDIELVDVSLGEVVIGPQSGPPVTVAIPPDAVSVTPMARCTSQPRQMVRFLNLVGPDGTLLFDFDPYWNEFTYQPNPWGSTSTELIAMLVPNSTPDRIPFTAGAYTFELATHEDSEGVGASCEAFARVKRGHADGGTLDVNVFLVGIGIAAASAPTDSDLQAGLQRFREIYATVNISLGEILYYDIDGAEADRLGDIDTTEELEELRRHSGTAPPRNAVDVFLVRRIGWAKGLSMTPGAPGEHGHDKSGTFVEVAGRLPEKWGVTVAHEVGHYLGLEHSTKGGTICGPGQVSTPEDPCYPEWVVNDPIADTMYLDQSNLMWGLSNPGTVLSDGQGYVMRRNPLIH